MPDYFKFADTLPLLAKRTFFHQDENVISCGSHSHLWPTKTHGVSRTSSWKSVPHHCPKTGQYYPVCQLFFTLVQDLFKIHARARYIYLILFISHLCKTPKNGFGRWKWPCCKVSDFKEAHGSWRLTCEPLVLGEWRKHRGHLLDLNETRKYMVHSNAITLLHAIL